MKLTRHAKSGLGKPTTQAGREQRKLEVLTHHSSSGVESIAEAMIIKDGDMYFVCDDEGDAPTTGTHGYGLYYQDTRYLSGYSLQIGQQRAHPLVAANRGGYKAVFQLANRRIRTPGEPDVDADSIGLTWTRMLRGERQALYDVMAFENFGLAPVSVPIELAFRADFEDIFAVRGLLDARPGKAHEPAWESERALTFRYDGADEVVRRIHVQFSARPAGTNGTRARFTLALAPGERREILVAVTVSEAHQSEAPPAPERAFPDLGEVEGWLSESADAWMKGQTSFTSNSLLLNRIIDRSLRDLHTLRSELDGRHFFAAGVPWFSTLFGRDSVIANLQTLAFNPGLAEDTLRLLAAYQGTETDEWRDEEPGKILHELRVGEFANLKAVPHYPNYGTIDATALFLILVVEHARWTGRLDVFTDLRDHVERALAWIDMACERGGGYLTYTSPVGDGIVNQGWKDSGNAMVDAQGRMATPPIAVVEVQGYMYRAKRGVADLFERLGDSRRAAALREEASRLKARFNRDFWLEDLRCLAMALERNQKPLAVISSNAGQALWSGIVDDAKAAEVAKHLLDPGMFSGWGVRTLATHEKRYNPVSYHLGSVWPHDNALIAAGLRRYGLDAEARRIFRGIFEAATHFDQHRMPELFSGFDSDAYGEPVRYPVACHPQAWAAGSLPYMLTTMLGLEPDGFQGRLRVVRPLLPDFLTDLEMHGVRVGAGRLAIRFRRDGEQVTVTKLSGDIELVVDPT